MKSFLQYAALVGVFTLGVLGILRLGSGLRAPASVGGLWTMHLTLPPEPDSACAPAWLSTDSAELVISQSGPELVLTWNDPSRMRLTGQLTGLKIHATSRHAPGWRLAAEIDRQAEPDQLTGTLASDNCPDAIHLAGVRQQHRTSLTGEH